MIMMAFALLLGMTQCKKETTNTNNDNTESLSITLKVDNGDKGDRFNLYPSTGAVVFTAGDSIFVGNNGKYVGTLKFRDGLFQGTISGDLSTSDRLHFYFVGNKPTSTAPVAGTTTSCTVDISDQTEYLPVISYAPSTVNYSPSTTFYTAQLLNKSALVKFVPSEEINSPITVLGMNNEVKIDFENNTLAPTSTTGGITLYSVSGTEKWAILLEQAAVPTATVTISDYNATASVPPITNNMFYTTGVGITMTAIQKYYAHSDDWQSVVAAFNAEQTPYPMLIFEGNLSSALTITRANGVVDFNGHTIPELFVQNNTLGESVTFKNGTVSPNPVDGAGGYSNFYQGTVILENMTVTNTIYTDAHAYVFYSGTYNTVNNYPRDGYPSTVVIYGGKFSSLTGGGQYTLYGGKYKYDYSSWCAPGYSVKSNTDSDSGTYPYIVSAD